MAAPEAIPQGDSTLVLTQDHPPMQEASTLPESLPGIVKVEHLKVRIREGEEQFQAELTPVKDERTGTAYISGRRVKGVRQELESRYSFGPEVIALMRTEAGRPSVWEIVEGGVALYPVITYDGLRIAIFNRQQNQ